MRIDEVKPNEIPFNLKVPGGIICGAFDSMKLYPALYDQVNEKTFDYRKFAEILCLCIVRWDLMISDTEPYPITVESIMHLPFPILKELIEAMVNAEKGNPPMCMDDN